MEIDKLEKSILLFLEWLEAYGEISYDRMDYWSSKIGILTKKLFYKNRMIGAPLALWGLTLENFLPNIQKLFATSRREAIGDSHYALGFLNMYELTDNIKYLLKAEHYLDILLQNSSEDYSGYCWGYTFGWETPTGFWPAGIPFITVTPYAFWAFKKHYELTETKSSLDVCRSIAKFALNDLNEKKMPNGTCCSSYSPIDKSSIINANTYRASLLLDAYYMFNVKEYKRTAERNLRFVISYQGNKGEWYYEAKSKEDNFIDNFHTCFVMRNLYRCYLINKDLNILDSIRKGYEYYRKNLFRSDGTPIHFAKSKYFKLRKYEMYDYAEGITLGCLLDKHIVGSFDFSRNLADDLINRFQLKEGYFTTRVTSIGTKHNVPYHRWPQAQLFYALTKLQKKLIKV